MDSNNDRCANSSTAGISPLRRTTQGERMSWGGSPGLVVMGGDSCPKGRRFDPSTIYWMDIFSHLFVVKIVMFVWKDKNKLKEAGNCPLEKEWFWVKLEQHYRFNFLPHGPSFANRSISFFVHFLLTYAANNTWYIAMHYRYVKSVIGSTAAASFLACLPASKKIVWEK